MNGLQEPWLAGLIVFFAGMLLVAEFLVKARGLAGVSGVALLCLYAWTQSPSFHSWSLGLLLVGLALMILDGKLIQDGTIAGIGMLMMLVGLVLPTGDFLTGSLVGILWILGLLAGFLSLKVLPRREVWDRIVLKDSLTREQGYRSVNAKFLELIGREGETLTDLRPSGTISVDGERFSCTSGGAWVKKGTPVRVVSVDGTRILVEPLPEDHAG
ncbi:NfeD family protein [Kroppenstedtia sanguinis]|uniref:NfeD family protein n=1 Tax=Kroppenstedtia sanguinis TaxID=1380684 RepID=A0ABW4C6K9_9BACL